MLISCKCLNFVATSPKLQRSSSVNSDGGAGVGCVDGLNGTVIRSIAAALLEHCKRTIPSDFEYFPLCLEFLMLQGSVLVPDLTINTIKVPELLYGITLDLNNGQSWQLSICIQCKQVVCAKRLSAGRDAGAQTCYIINRSLLTSNDTLVRLRDNKAYSECFGLLILENSPGSGMVSSTSSQSIGSLSSNFSDGQAQRLRQLHANQQERVQDEIAKTNERIERFTQSQFELLNSFREKTNQDYTHLVRLINQVRDPAIMDHAMLPCLEVTGNLLSTGSFGGPRGGRRNTIGSRRDLNVPTTPTATLAQPSNYQTLPQQQLQPLLSGASSVVSARKMSNFDTPPATPEATPMSVGNSPTFRQQAGIPARPPMITTNSSSSANGGADEADDCLFDLEDVDDVPTPVHTSQTSSFTRAQMYQQQQHHQQHYQRLQHQQLDNSMDNVDEGVAADEAEYAVDLDSSMPIPMRGARPTPAQLMNFARSLPIEISNSPLAERANNNFVVEDEEVLDNIDIAASIKALAKSVHGEAVFGDLPRPRLSSQI